MDGARRKRVRATAKRSRGRRTSEGGDLISDLPDSLLCQVLLKLTTKDVVRTSVLSSRWSNLWRCVPGLDLDGDDINYYYQYATFVDRFLDFNSGCQIESFKLSYPGDGNSATEIDRVRRWIRTVVRLGVKHLGFFDYSWDCATFHLPRSIYTCKSLVSLNLCDVSMPRLKLVSLPCLRMVKLIRVKFADILDLETLITSCAALESLRIRTSYFDPIEVLRVRSQSLLSFTLIEENGLANKDLVFDAPRLEYLKLKLSDHQIARFIIKYPDSLASVDIKIVFNSSLHQRFDPSDVPKTYMLHNFLIGISRVKNMTMSSSTLKVIYDYSKCEPLPLFSNLSFLRVKFNDNVWEMLPTFLESCPNLKSLILESTKNLKTKGICMFSEGQGFLPSLEYVEIKMPIKGFVMEMKFVGYFLEKSANLKKLTLCLDDSRKTEKSVIVKNSVIVKKLLTIPRLSPSCEVVVS